MTINMNAAQMDTSVKLNGDLVWQTDHTVQRPMGLYVWNGQAWERITTVPLPTPPVQQVYEYFDADDPIHRKIPTNATYVDHPQLHRVNGGALRQFWSGGNQCGIWHQGASDDVDWTINVNAHRGRPAKQLKLRISAGFKGNGQDDNFASAVCYVGSATPIIFDFWKLIVNDSAKHVASASAWACCNADGTPGGQNAALGVWVAGSSFGDGPPATQDWTSGKTAGIRAANSSTVAGCVTNTDISKIQAGGQFDHALVLAVRSELRANAASPPATGWETSGPPTGPMNNGDRLCLPRSFVIPTAVTLLVRAFLVCLQEFGAYVMDGTGSEHFEFFIDKGLSAVDQAIIDAVYANWINANGISQAAVINALRYTRSYS